MTQFDDSELRESINSLEQRISALEKIQNAYKNKLTINSITATKDGYILVFSDNSIVEITNGKDGDTLESINVLDDAILFILSDGTSFSIPLTMPLSISLQCEDEIMMAANSSREIKYEVTSNIDIDIEVLTSADLNAKVCPDDESKKKGHILLITKEDEMTEYSKIIILVSNGTSTIMKKLSFTQEGMEIVDNSSKTASCDGGQISLEFFTDGAYDVVIPDNAKSWISIAPVTRSIRKENVILQVKRNKGKARSAEIIVKRENSIVSLVYYIHQDAYAESLDRPAIEFTPKSDREVLIDIYNALDGHNYWSYSNWCTDLPISEWGGVKVDPITGRVTEIIGIHDAKGKIPATIGNLTELKKLEFLQITTNYIPEEIGMLTNLEYFVIRALPQNHSMGMMPESIGKLTNLKYLDLDVNWTGIPESISNLKKLETLSLHFNNIGGKIPNCIGELINLRELDLSHNNFSGYLPQSLENLTQLEVLDLGNNNLSGEIPSYIGNFSKLKILSLYMNHFSGQIPRSITNLSLLTELVLSDNNISGSIPSDIGNLKNLRVLNLEELQLNGNIPESILQLENLEDLMLFMNELTGTIPKGIGDLKNISSVRLGYNKLSGEIPYDLGNVKNQVWLNQNNLTGPVPESFRDKDWFRNGWGQIVDGNNLNLEGLLPVPAPDFEMYSDTEWRIPVQIDELYNKDGITILFQWTSSCSYFNDAYNMLKNLHESYEESKVKIISMTFNRCESTALTMPWNTYYNSQLFYPTYAVPTITVIYDGMVVWSDLIQDRKDLPNFIKEYYF